MSDETRFDPITTLTTEEKALYLHKDGARSDVIAVREKVERMFSEHYGAEQQQSVAPVEDDPLDNNGANVRFRAGTGTSTCTTAQGMTAC